MTLPAPASAQKQMYRSVGRGFAPYWVTLTLDGRLEPALVGELIDESYRLVVKGLPRAVRAQLPAGAASAE